MRDFDDEFEAAFGTRFGALHGSVAAVVPLPGVEEIIVRGRRRRRNGQAALGGIAVLAIVAVASVVFGPLRPDGAPLPPVNPTPSAGPAYVPPAGAFRAPLGGTVPAGFLPGGTVAGSARLEPLCEGRAALSSNGSVTASSSTVDGSVTLLVFPAGISASRAYDEYVAEAQRCVSASRKVEPLTFGAEGFKVVSSKPTSYLAVVRYGRSLLLVRGASSDAVRRAGVLERSLCVYATDCAPRQRLLPAALPALSVGGTAWAAVLAVSATPDDPALGQSVALASEMGYRTSVASVDCDDGARAAFGLPVGSVHRYVAVYFGSRSDAEEFASAARQTPTAIIEVRTYCLG